MLSERHLVLAACRSALRELFTAELTACWKLRPTPIPPLGTAAPSPLVPGVPQKVCTICVVFSTIERKYTMFFSRVTSLQGPAAKWGGLCSWIVFAIVQVVFGILQVVGGPVLATNLRGSQHERQPSTSNERNKLDELYFFTNQGPELPRQPLFGGEALQGDVLEWKAE